MCFVFLRLVFLEHIRTGVIDVPIVLPNESNNVWTQPSSGTATQMAVSAKHNARLVVFPKSRNDFLHYKLKNKY